MQNPMFIMKDKIKEKFSGKKIIAIYSGKGGVGKTTIASNLAIVLSEKKKTALIDMDINGSNVASYLDINYNKPIVENGKLKCYEYKFNNNFISGKLDVMSISFLAGNEALLWRGPLLTKAVDDLLNKVDYENNEYFVLDLPPGTSDIPLTLMQMVPIYEIIIVTTPHKLALIDAEKSIKMAKNMNVNVFGVIENMSGEIFGRDRSEKLAEIHNTNYLGSIKLSKETADKKITKEDYLLYNKIVDDILRE